VVLLILGGEYFVESSVSLASHLKVPRILIGTTLVSLATTAPELAVSVRASWLGQPELALGNAVGSAIANIALILGLLCVLRPMAVHAWEFRLPSWVMLGLGALLMVLTSPLWVGRGAGIGLLLCGATYLTVDYVRHRRHGTRDADDAEAAVGILSLPKSIVLFVFGACMVIGGGELLCTHGAALARHLGVPPLIVGLTMVAFGTSVPELVTMLHAARKGVPDLSLGNVVGANILNLTLVTGSAATIHPLVLPSRMHHLYSFGAMVFIFVLLKVMAHTGPQRLTRREGCVLIGAYVVYLVGLLTFRL